MPALFVYLTKVNIVLALFYLAYRYLLRPLTFYTLNRIFLVFGILFSTGYPFVNLAALFKRNRPIPAGWADVIPDWQPEVISAAGSQKAVVLTAHFNYWIIPEAIFWLGVGVMGLRLVRQLVSLGLLHRRSVPQVHGRHQFRVIEEKINPFSFLNTIYLNTTLLKPGELSSVLEHERVHVKEAHTLDVLLAELNVVFYWFNPGAWLLRGAVKENLEFIADRLILQQGVEPIAYQHELLRMATLKRSSPIVNHFSLLTLKRRIIMINTTRTSSIQMARYLVAVPLVILFAFAFTVTKAQLGEPTITFGKKPDFAISSMKKQVMTQQVKGFSITAGKSERPVDRSSSLSSESGNQPVAYASISDSVKFSKYLLDGKPTGYLVDGKPVAAASVTENYPDISRSISYHLNSAAAARIFGPAYASSATTSLILTYRNRSSQEVKDVEAQIDPAEDAELEIRYEEAKLPGAGRYSYGKPYKITYAGYLEFADSHPLTRADGSGFDWINDTQHTLYFIDGKESTAEKVNNLPADKIQQVRLASVWGSPEMSRQKLADERKAKARTFPIVVNNEEDLRKLVRVQDILPVKHELYMREVTVPVKLVGSYEKRDGIVLVTTK